MNLSPPAAKKPRLSYEKQVSDLADADLAAIFERLPPYERLIASEVCRRWYALSRKKWLDVTCLDLSPIPAKYFASIVRQSPNLCSVFAVKKSFGLNELVILAKSNKLSTVKLYDCNVKISDDPWCVPIRTSDLFAKMFSENLQHASWNELILHDVGIDNKTCPSLAVVAMYLPAYLTRLQLSGVRIIKAMSVGLFLNGLERLQNLECFMLHKAIWLPGNPFEGFDIIGASTPAPMLQRICALKKLRELSVGPACRCNTPLFWRLISSLPKLEVLFLHQIAVENTEDFAQLITNSAVLRILVISGKMLWPTLQPIDLPARKRFPRGFGYDPLPLLHVFVGKSASEHLRFAQSESDAALIHYIDAPMPQFLEREDIAPIFEGCWIAEKIKETAKNGGKIWHYEPDDCCSSVQHS